MKTKNYIIFTILLLFPIVTKAASGGISCSSNSVYVGDTITCTISGYDTQVAGVKANISYSGNLTLLSANKTNCPIGEVSANYVDCSTDIANGGITVATFSFRANFQGTANVTMSGVEIVNQTWNAIGASNASYQININNRPAPTPAPTPSPTPAPAPNNPTPQEQKKDSSLKNVTIEGTDFKFESGKEEYNITVDNDIEKLNIKYEANDSKSIVKLEGNDSLKVGENIIKLIVTNDNSTKTYTFKINRLDMYKDLKFEDDIEKELQNKYKTILKVEVKDIDDMIVSKKVLDLIKSSGRTVIYNIYKGENILYSITFDGTKLDEINGYFDLKLSLSTTKFDKLKSKYYLIDILQKNNLKGEIVIKFKNAILDGTCYLYKINGENYKFDSKIDTKENSDISLTLSDFVNYILIQDKIEGTKTFNGMWYVIIGGIVLVLANIIYFIVFFIKKRKAQASELHPSE